MICPTCHEINIVQTGKLNNRIKVHKQAADSRPHCQKLKWTFCKLRARLKYFIYIYIFLYKQFYPTNVSANVFAKNTIYLSNIFYKLSLKKVEKTWTCHIHKKMTASKSNIVEELSTYYFNFHDTKSLLSGLYNFQYLFKGEIMK